MLPSRAVIQTNDGLMAYLDYARSTGTGSVCHGSIRNWLRFRHPPCEANDLNLCRQMSGCATALRERRRRVVRQESPDVVRGSARGSNVTMARECRRTTLGIRRAGPVNSMHADI